MRAKSIKMGGRRVLNMSKNLRPRSKITGSLQTVFISSCDVHTTSHRSLRLLNVYTNELFCLFDLILYVPSTIFQLCRDGSSWVEPVLS